MSTPSLPPSFASFPDIHSEQSSSRNEPEHRRKDKGEKRKRRDDKHHRKEERDRKRHRPQTDDVKPSTTLAGDDRETWRLFYSDRRGDMLNIQFGGLHVGHIPKYHLVGGGRSVLGLSSAWTSHRSGKGISVEVRGQRKFRELLDPGVRALLSAEPKWRILASGDVYKHKEVNGFLPLPSHRQEDSQAYRSIIQTKADNDSESESDLERESESEESDSDGLTLTSHQESLKLLEQQLSENPTSVKLWLSLLAQTLSTVPLLSKNATKAQAEITLPVLSRAISADPTNAKSKVLRIKYLKAGEEVWQESKLEDEWEDALKIGGPEIWMEWLEWRIRRGRKGIDGVTEHAVRAMRAFSSSDLGGELAKLRIFWRVAVAFQHAGYTERATALFQAQAEITFKSPHSLRKSAFDSLLESFEEFWESETPRVGEPTARGWDAWVASGNKQGATSASTSVPNATLELDPYRQWAANELIADHALTLPARSTDELAASDPYSTILFADIRPLLFDLRTSKGRNAFRLAWISFLGLHVPGFYKTLSHPSLDELEADWDDRWCFTHLRKTSHLKAMFAEVHELRQPQADAIAGVLVGRENQYSCSFGPVKNWSSGVLGALQAVFFRITDGSKRKEKQCFMWEKEDLEDVDEQRVRNIFTQLNTEDDDPDWYNLSLAYEAALGVKSALKLSRHYLSTAQNSVYRWASHAQLERMRGRFDDARKVYHTVLIASPHLAGKAQLWWDWAEMEWLSNKRQEALGVVTRSAGVEGKGGVAVLRAGRILEDTAKSSEKWKEREAWIKLGVLLELLTTGDAITALDLFDSHHPEEGSSEHESLMVASLLIVYYHSAILQNPMPPSLLRERARKAIEIYPSNSIILGLFLEGEKGQGVWGRIRSSMGESGGKSKDVARRVEEVWVASWKKGWWSEEIERVRSGLSAAVEHERTRASPVIWRIYIEFELRANDLQRAKNLLYRAVAECPLVKELYLLAFGPLRSIFRKEELANFADTMAERGIRMRQGLDEVLEGWTMVEERGGEENNEQLDEIEENARELRRLMPY